MGKRNNSNDNLRMGKLFYAAILTDRECDFGAIGLNNEVVCTVNYKDVAALVSDYPRVSTIKLLKKNLSPYHRVVNGAAKRFTTIPARFGQIARDAGEVGVALRRNYGSIRRELSRLDGKVEMGLKVCWDVENLFEHFIERDKSLKALRDKLKAKGSVSKMEQINFGHYFHERMNQSRTYITETILAALPPGEARVEDIREDSMIANTMLLIRKDLRQQFEDAIDGLGKSMGNEYSLKLDGPWPPFSFVDRVELHLSHSVNLGQEG
ncbi:MAG: GvpL/GvpF family gas vesicle protein [Candidatus Hydrothermarchaeaceae archaeon]